MRIAADLFGAEVVVIIPDLIYQAYQIRQWQYIVRCRTSTLHQSSCQPKQTPCLVRDHEQVLILCRYCHGMTPEQLDALPAVQIQHLLIVDAESLQRVAQRNELFLCKEVRIVSCINTLSSAKDTVCCWKATPQLGAVLDVINPETLVSFS